MRWPWQRPPTADSLDDPSHVEEARQAVHTARMETVDAMSNWLPVSATSAELEHQLRVNHIGARVRQAIGGPDASAAP